MSTDRAAGLAPPLTPERRREQTREYLLTAAAHVFGEQGFHGASLDAVAAAAGFTKGAVYSNFKSKDDLFLALLEQYFERSMAAVQRTIDASEVPPEARLSDFVAHLTDHSQDQPANWGLLYQEFCVYAMRNPAARAKLAEVDRQVVEAIARVIAVGQARRGAVAPLPAADLERLARLVMAMDRGIAVTRALDPDLVDEPFLQAAIAFIAGGLGFES